MKIDLRTTHTFAEISVDLTEETIFYSHEKELEEFINNLLSVADELADKTGKSLIERVMYH